RNLSSLREALLCPVCLELFTPPVLVLSCAHNFCKQCLEKILIHQNYHHVNGHFHCPLCRKVSRGELWGSCDLL
uniref:RING-type domain-containing protein n=1 Tax=Cairina moschata TaxID=8855 RepID=A0A8C3D3T7_CAIMO